MVKFESLKTIINDHSRFLVTTHRNPDADAIGSQLAMYHILRKLGKEVLVINHSGTPYNLTFLDKDNVIEKYSPDKHNKVISEVEVIIFTDLNQISRTGSMAEFLSNLDVPKVCIDHHRKPDNFTQYKYIDIKSIATGEIIYNFIKKTGITELDYDIALQIYSAIVTDSGSFNYDRTSPQTHIIAAELLECGVDPSYVHEQIYQQDRISRLKLLGETLCTLNFHAEGQIAYMTITQEAINKTEASDEDVEGFVNYTLAVKGVKAGFLFYELKDGLKISFRSKGNIPINKLAAEFGGGGHLNAAGARLYNVDYKEYIQKIIQAAEKYL